MDDFEVNIKRLKEEINHMGAIINEYEECIELMGHLMRMFNREGYWDFKDRILVIYNQASRNEQNLKDLIKVMNAIDMHCVESEYIQDNVSKDKLVTYQDSSKLSESENIINLGIQFKLASELKIPLDNIDRLVSIKRFIDNKGYECYSIKYNTNDYHEDFILNQINNTTWKDYINEVSMDRSIFTYE